MGIAKTFLDNVVFLGRTVSHGSFGEEWKLLGTGFIVGVPSSRHPGNTFYYLVTAKHVADCSFGGRIVVRMNTKSGSAIFASSVEDKTRWWTHPIEGQSVDAAVTTFVPSAELDLTYLSVDDFLNDCVIEERGIGPGDDVFVVGVFSKMQGKERNTPIVRTGSVAAMPAPGELIPNVEISGWRGDIDGYLIESRSLGGLSGSPVFVAETMKLSWIE